MTKFDYRLEEEKKKKKLGRMDGWMDSERGRNERALLNALLANSWIYCPTFSDQQNGTADR